MKQMQSSIKKLTRYPLACFKTLLFLHFHLPVTSRKYYHFRFPELWFTPAVGFSMRFCQLISCWCPSQASCWSWSFHIFARITIRPSVQSLEGGRDYPHWSLIVQDVRRWSSKYLKIRSYCVEELRVFPWKVTVEIVLKENGYYQTLNYPILLPLQIPAYSKMLAGRTYFFTTKSKNILAFPFIFPKILLIYPIFFFL